LTFFKNEGLGKYVKKCVLDFTNPIPRVFGIGI